MYSTEVIKCRISEVSMIDEETLFIDIEPNHEFILDDFYELMEAAKKLGGGRRFYNLVHVGSHCLPTHEARTASTSIEGSIYKLADAFVIHSFSQKLVANFYMNFHKPVVPTKFFNDLGSAREWLDQLKKKAEKKKQLAI